MIEPVHPKISIARQCELLDFSRGAYYYTPHPMSEENLYMMRLMDEEYTRHPFKGSRRLKTYLEEQGFPVSRERVRRLMGLLGIEAIYPKPRLSASNKAHKKYPYLLGNIAIVSPDQVWCSDITYIRLNQDFAYLTVVMDWFSRYILSWELSSTLESDFCVKAPGTALQISQPEIFNTDQGSQYTSEDFTEKLLSSGIRISMDGKGRAFDNIMVERFWRTLKYEDVYLKEYGDFFNALDNLEAYFYYYNEERRHSSLGNWTPAKVYREGRNKNAG